MRKKWTVASLVEFEKDIEDTFNRGEIRSPIHLAGGNERKLIDIFRFIRNQDYVCCTWRSHYHALLKGVPPEELKAAIVAGRSIALCFPEYRIISSAMVAGIAPIALGLAWAIEKAKLDEVVWCFLGDMAAASGLAYECMNYAKGHNLPIVFVVEDNGLSVATNTEEVWGYKDRPGDVNYRYVLPHDHVGTKVWVSL